MRFGYDLFLYVWPSGPVLHLWFDWLSHPTWNAWESADFVEEDLRAQLREMEAGASKKDKVVHEKSSENGWFWDTPNFRKPPYDMSFKQQPQHVPTTCPRKTAKIAWLQVLVSDIFLNLGLSESRVSPTLMFNHNFSQFFVKRGHLGRYSRLHFQTHSNHTYHRLLVG